MTDLVVVMAMNSFDRLIIALLTAGGATFVWTVAKSVIAFKNSAEGREDKAVGRLESFEADCRRQLTHERRWSGYWQRRAARYERLLLVNGIDIPADLEPEPPLLADEGGKK